MRNVVLARPRATLIMALLLAAILLAGGIWVWIALGADVRARVTWYQLATLVLFLAAGVGGLVVMASSFVRADAEGLTYRNFLRTRRLPWPAIERLRFEDGDPFAYAYVREASRPGRERVQLLGIQQTDGARGRRLFAELRELQRSSQGTG